MLLEFHAPDGMCTADAEDRNSRIFRMAEDIADEIRTQQPGARINIELLTGCGQIVALS